MRILFLTTVYPRAYAATQGVFNRLFCDALSHRHEVRVISPVGWLERFRQGNPYVQKSQAADRPQVDYPCYFYTPKMLRDLSGWFMWRSIRGAIRRIADEFHPECVLSYWLHPDGEVANWTAQSFGVPSGVIVGGSDARLLPREPNRRQRIARVLAETDALFPVSEGLKKTLVELGTPEAKIHAIYQGIDANHFSPGDQAATRRRLGLSIDVKTLLWVGRMVPVKGLEILLEACAILKNRGRDFHLQLIGDGPLRHSLEVKTHTLGLTQTITFAGSVLPEQLPAWYRAADLTVLSSWSEGIPNVLRESLACGTPFVATRVGDIAEFCPEMAHQLVPPGDPVALANAIGNAITGPVNRPIYSRPPSWDDYAAAISDLLESVANARHNLDSKRLYDRLMAGVTFGEKHF